MTTKPPEPKTDEQVARELALKYGLYKLAYDERGYLVSADGTFKQEPLPDAVAAILEALSLQREQDANKCVHVSCRYTYELAHSVAEECAAAIRGEHD